MFAHLFAALAAAWNYFDLYLAPALAAVLLPSLITGLTSIPKTAGLVRYLLLAVRFCAAVTHRDEAGTFKLPFGLGTVLQIVISFFRQPPPAAGAAALALLFAFSSGCGYCLDVAHKLEPRCQVQDIASKCGLPAVEKVVQQIFPQVVLALVNDSWSSLLDTLVNTLEQQGVQDALQAVTCAVSSTDVNISSVTGGARSTSLNPAVIQATHEHAVAWLGLHHVMARR
jgi:hypothetical protein